MQVDRQEVPGDDESRENTGEVEHTDPLGDVNADGLHHLEYR